VLDYASLYRASNETTPVVFVLSPGADPAFDVLRQVARVQCLLGAFSALPAAQLL
jgi:hypothetical protein